MRDAAFARGLVVADLSCPARVQLAKAPASTAHLQVTARTAGGSAGARRQGPHEPNALKPQTVRGALIRPCELRIPELAHQLGCRTRVRNLPRIMRGARTPRRLTAMPMHVARPAQDSNLESPAPKADVLSIRPTGRLCKSSFVSLCAHAGATGTPAQRARVFGGRAFRDGCRGVVRLRCAEAGGSKAIGSVSPLGRPTGDVGEERSAPDARAGHGGALLPSSYAKSANAHSAQGRQGHTRI